MARILIVEDHELNLELMSDLLTARGHEIVAATEVSEALSKLASVTVDVALLDIHVPGGGGREVLRSLRADERLSDIPALAVTASAMAGDKERLLSEGFDGYASKPIDVASFGSWVESYL